MRFESRPSVVRRGMARADLAASADYALIGTVDTTPEGSVRYVGVRFVGAPALGQFRYLVLDGETVSYASVDKHALFKEIDVLVDLVCHLLGPRTEVDTGNTVVKVDLAGLGCAAEISVAHLDPLSRDDLLQTDEARRIDAQRFHVEVDLGGDQLESFGLQLLLDSLENGLGTAGHQIVIRSDVDDRHGSLGNDVDRASAAGLSASEVNTRM